MSTTANNGQKVHTHITANSAGAVALGLAAFGQGSGPIVMDNVQCLGTEERLVDCPHATSHNCNHLEDASVRCSISELELATVEFTVRMPVKQLLSLRSTHV